MGSSVMSRVSNGYGSVGPGQIGDQGMTNNVGVNFQSSGSNGGDVSVQVTGVMILVLVAVVVWASRSL